MQESTRKLVTVMASILDAVVMGFGFAWNRWWMRT